VTDVQWRANLGGGPWYAQARMSPEPQRTIDAVWRAESPRLIGALTRLVRDVAIAEELAQDALVAALEQWPRDGIPENPGAWLTSTAKHRALDVLRRGSLLAGKHEALARELEAIGVPALEERPDDLVGDDLLRLIFIACHPVLPSEARVALTLRLLGGLTTPEIARAFVVPEATIAQRIVRAKRALSEARVPFELPSGDELADRLGSVLGVVYLIFNEGYAATGGDDLLRPALCEDALRLGRLLAQIDPGEPEVHGLLALMELQASRFAARTRPNGEPITLLEQDRARWDHPAIARGLAALARAQALGGALGPYALQASIAACHAQAGTAAQTDWGRIAALYDVLAALAPQPIIELNRALAHAMVFGPQVGLDLLEPVTAALAGYHLLPSVRGELLEKLGRLGEARTEFEKAASLTGNTRQKALLLARARRVTSST
jgi:RNA polymerase sigma factor (sigma-70 family)